eukprot:NODE_30896_length_408_cov_0.861210.p1 GENE.NODE_30896_length_408_cov_0.861210~~NODE_30896_length_408_cov_0.861210.p1  ORF type:complete len:106 (-),score=14.25 NODE_30896_length_408_cov_0.861210:59-376(-)
MLLVDEVVVFIFCLFSMYEFLFCCYFFFFFVLVFFFFMFFGFFFFFFFFFFFRLADLTQGEGRRANRHALQVVLFFLPISRPTKPYKNSFAVFPLKKKKNIITYN